MEEEVWERLIAALAAARGNADILRRALTYYALDGTTVVETSDITVWDACLRDDARIRVARTALPNGIEVSTMFVGLDMSGGDPVPQVFETLAWDGDTEFVRHYWPTWHAAEQGHQAVVDAVRSLPPLPADGPVV